MTLDLPTPPLPLATAYTRVREPGWANGMTGSAPPAPAQAGLQLLALLGGHHPEVDRHRGDPGDRADRGGDVVGQLVPQRAAGDGEQQLDPDGAVGADREPT